MTNDFERKILAFAKKWSETDRVNVVVSEDIELRTSHRNAAKTKAI